MAIILVKQIIREKFTLMNNIPGTFYKNDLNTYGDYYSDEFYINTDHLVRFKHDIFEFYMSLMNSRTVQKHTIETLRGKNSIGEIFEYELDGKLLSWFNNQK